MIWAALPKSIVNLDTNGFYDAFILTMLLGNAALYRQCRYMLCLFTRHLKNKPALQVIQKPTLRGRRLSIVNGNIIQQLKSLSFFAECVMNQYYIHRLRNASNYESGPCHPAKWIGKRGRFRDCSIAFIRGGKGLQTARLFFKGYACSSPLFTPHLK